MTRLYQSPGISMEFLVSDIGSFVTCVAGFLGFTFVAVLYGTWPMFYWEKRNIRGPRPWPYVGNTLDFREEGMHHCFIKWNKEFGRVYGVYMLRRPILVITDPEMLKEIMVKNFSNFTDKYTLTDRKSHHHLFSKMLPFSRGAEWKRIRTIITPAFSTKALKSVEVFISDCSVRMVASIQEMSAKEDKLSMKDIYGAFTLDMIAAILFGVGLDSMVNSNSPMFFHAKEVMKNTTTRKIVFILSGLFPILRAPLRLMGFTVLPKKDLDFFLENGTHILEERKRNESETLDFLQMLINAQNNESSSKGLQKLSNDEIVAQLAIFFVAGYETTANTLAFLTHSIAGNPDVHDRLSQEVDQVIGDKIPNSENIQQLKYMDAVVQETLRLFPPIPYLTREAKEDCIIKGVHIEAGAAIFIPGFAIGHDAEFFPDPESFKPERFLDDSVNPMTNLPFGVGPRQCIGMRLAYKEIKIALVHVLRKFRFSNPNTLTWAKDMNPTFLCTSSPVTVKATPRNEASDL